MLFLYRDGEKLLAQVRHVLGRFVGQRVEGYLSAVGATTRAVVYGLVLTAIAQGALAGLGLLGGRGAVTDAAGRDHHA